MARSIVKHTISVPIPGFEELEATFNVAPTGAQVNAANDANVLGAFLLDLPNWDEVAATNEDLQDEDGTPLPKPIPLAEHFPNLPGPLGV